MRKTIIIVGLIVSNVSSLVAQICPPGFFDEFYIADPDESALPDLNITDCMNGVAQLVSRDGAGFSGNLRVDYYDGLGRPMENIQVGAAPLGHDIVSLQEYDSYGRKGNTWLPASVTTAYGDYIQPSQVTASSMSSNEGDSAPYSYPVYEQSTLNRVVGMFGPGANWHTAVKKNSIIYLTNSTTDNQLNCRKFSFSNLADGLMSITANGNYATGTLQVSKTVNEDGEVVIEFYDSMDRIVLSRRIGASGALLDTYYLYDGLGNLCAVLPPRLTEQAGAGNLSAVEIDRLGYLYQYDSRNRLVSKKLPGASAVFMAYDEADRMVFSQDGVQRDKGVSTFFIYDVYGRECLKGECSLNLFPSDASSVGGYVCCSMKNGGRYMGYAISGITLTSPQIMTVHYYDNYTFLTDDSLQYVNDESFGLMHPYPKGLVTGIVSLRLDGEATAPIYDYEVMYYDEYNRVIQSHSTNILNGYEHRFTQYDFVGNPVRTSHLHSAYGKPSISETYWYTYDHESRLLTARHSLNGAQPVLLADNSYDELGRLSANSRNGVTSIRTNYEYNVRSWLKSISGPRFSEMLYYETCNSLHSNQPRYGGTISAIDWTADDNISRSCELFYDEVSRLSYTMYRENQLLNQHYDTTYEYDSNGNITLLQRNGRYVGSNYQEIDNLSMYYSGNQLVCVNNNASFTPSYYDAMYFHDGASSSTEYNYDNNGNLIKDLTRIAVE